MNTPPEKDELYYFDENGLLVFTEKYHLQRGHCCKCGCRHCQYGFNKEKQEEITDPKERLT